MFNGVLLKRILKVELQEFYEVNSRFETLIESFLTVSQENLANHRGDVILLWILVEQRYQFSWAG